MEISLPAYAKVNWTLDVLEKYPAEHRNAGYTKIETVFCRIDLHDVVSVRCEPSCENEIVIECANLRIPQSCTGDPERNVCFRAALALRDAIPELPPHKLFIHIDKKIPLAGGLGGSSTDGGAVLQALNALFELGISPARLGSIAAKFGSDTGFFASDMSLALGSERGEKLEALPSFPEPVSLVIVNPQIELPVKEVYSCIPDSVYVDAHKTRSRVLAHSLRGERELSHLAGLSTNSLERSLYVQKYFPDLEEIKRDLVSAGCLTALMSGSGASVFGICSSSLAAKEISQKMSQKFPSFQIIPTSTH